MFERLGTIEIEDKIKEIFNKVKYFLPLLLIIPVVIIIDHYTHTYGEAESKMVDLAKKYVRDNGVGTQSEAYIALGDLGEVEGAELCSNASGVIVTNKNNKYSYKPYLKCTNYETKIVSNSNKYITLSGDEVTILNIGEIYEERGYFSEDVVEVEMEGEVGYNPGIYTILYKVIIDGQVKQTLERKVIVTRYDKASTNSGVTSSEKPTLTLLGNTTMVLEVGEKFKDPGWKAVDYVDGKVSRKVKVTSSTKTRDMTKRPGTYPIVYTITNSRGQTETKTRIVRVVTQKSDIFIDSSIRKLTSGFAVVLKITGSGYSHTILPNGEQNTAQEITYKIDKNDTYSFAVYDVYNNVTVREVSVNDVDITGPTGECVASVAATGTTIYVNASDPSGISAYNYMADGSSSGFIKASTYHLYSLVEEAQAQVQDAYGNITTLKCQVNKGRGSMSNGMMNIPLYLQTSYTKPIKWYGGTTTVKSKGCGPTSVSMVVAYLTGNVTQNPQIIFEWLNSLNYFHGYGFGKAALTKAAARYGVSCVWQDLTESTMKQTLLNGRPIIAFMGKGQFSTGGHYIVLKGVDGSGKIAVNDPFYTKNNNQTFDASLILREKRVAKAFAVCN